MSKMRSFRIVCRIVDVAMGMGSTCFKHRVLVKEDRERLGLMTMFRFNFKLCLCVGVIAGMLAAALPAQAIVTCMEDFEGPPAPIGTVDALGWLGDSAPNVVYGPGVPAGLGTSVANAPVPPIPFPPGINTNITKPCGNTQADLHDLIEFKADFYLVGVYDVEGGEGMAGITGPGPNLWANTLLVGPNANPTNPGYPVNAGGWLVFDNLNDSGRVNLTDGGAPGVGNQFKGIGSAGRVRAEMTIDKTAATISVDLIDIDTTLSINPTFVIPLTAGGLAEVDNLNSLMMAWNDVHPGDTREIDNIMFTSIPEPSSIVLLGMALTPVVVLRRRWLS